MSSIPFYAINTSCRTATCSSSLFRWRQATPPKDLPISAGEEAPLSAAVGNDIVIARPTVDQNKEVKNKEVKDTDSMMHITKEEMYKEGERMCALDGFN